MVQRRSCHDVNIQDEVASFSSLHLGTGSFELTVTPGENYTAKVTLPGGVIKEFPLLAIKSTGTVLNVVNPVDEDSVTISLGATNDIVRSGESYFLMGKARGIICYAAVLNFKEGGKQILRSVTHRVKASHQHDDIDEE